MRLKRLELQGFKSFLDKTILTFDSSITGVVGPNGCGKSNIVDAILWVMGEQSPKHLRGHAMTDVIFNGTDTKSALSMAEVSLVLDRAGVALPPQFAAFDKGDEISVTRRICRDGEGEYLLNKTKCRLKDIHELFMDTGVGRRAYSIIEQGQIDRMINVKPEDRRVLFEEVAGITKYKAKRKEAERKLENTRQNLLRLDDIVGELEKRMRSLKIQASRARKYKELKIELEEADLFLLGRRYQGFKTKIRDLVNRKDELNTQRAEREARLGELDANVTQLEVTRVDKEKAIQELSQQEREIALGIQRLEHELTLFEERKNNIRMASQQAVKEEESLRDQLSQIATERQGYEAQKQEITSQLEQAQTEIEAAESLLNEKKSDLKKHQQEREEVQLQVSRCSRSKVEFEANLINAQSRETECAGKRQALNEKLSALVVTISELQERSNEVDAKIEECARRSEQAESEARLLHADCQQTSKKLSEVEDQLFSRREEYQSKKSRLDSLQELQENLEGYAPSAKEILLKLEDFGIQAKPLAEVLQPEKEIEEHLEMLLGAEINTLIVPTRQDLQQLTERICEKDLERVRILALDELPARDGSIAEFDGCQSILRRIRTTPGYERAVHHWLADVYVCPTREVLFELRQAHPTKIFITEDNRTVAHADHSVTGGKLPSSTGVFARRRELDELVVYCEELGRAVDQVSQEREKTLNHLESQEQRHSLMKDQLSQIHVESVESRKERESCQLQRKRADDDYDLVMKDSEANIVELERFQEEIAVKTKALVDVAEQEGQFKERSHELEQLITSVGETLEVQAEQIHAHKVERSRMGEQLHGLDFKINKIESETERFNSRIVSLEEQRAREQAELNTFDERVAAIDIDKQNAQDKLNGILVELSDNKATFDQACTEINEARLTITKLHHDRDSIQTEVQETELNLTQEQSKLEHLNELAIERYQKEASALAGATRVDVEKMPLLQEQLEVSFDVLTPKEQEDILSDHVENVRNKVSRYGEVNLTAIQEFEEIEGRHNFMIEQKQDLEKAIQMLEEAIVKINESTKARFEDTYVAVDKKFKEIFPILFNGGKAELKLTDPDNLLDSGVDIMVQPPGKRLQSISLLSGGEKALTAVSLVLAIFARKPSPFCLLDEVDAPLDDANVSRFNTVIRKMAEKTQFIVITHNKKTMEIAESLYGVTMERAGISRMASVSLT